MFIYTIISMRQDTKHKMSVLKYLVVSIFLHEAISDVRFSCENKKTCGECIGNAYESCVWCSESDVIGPRCFSERVSNQSCNGLVYPKHELETFKVLQNIPINGATGYSDGTIFIQLAPQRVKVTARPGKQVFFNISYKPAKDRALDIYYLIDNSHTMVAHKTELTTNGYKIPEVLSKVSNNIRLGVGTFVDKPGLPYAKQYNNAYSFKHHLSLTSDVELFKEAVGNLTNVSNFDDQEGGFDALMQAMVCENEIGWRPDAWRVIVFCTDATYHSAGDGKMVGAFKKNDMKCHLENGLYTDALKFDYPSVGQINHIVLNKKFTIIFAATQSVSAAYKALEKNIKWSKYAELKERSNIVEIIEEQYKTLTQNLQLDTVVPDGMQLIINPECNLKDNPDCFISYNSTKYLKVAVTLSSCSDYAAEINAIGLHDKLTIEVKSICACPCEKERIENSSKCSSGGNLQCGICKCNDNRYGEICECDLSSATSLNVNKCKAQNDTETCSGRGTCRCGTCVECKTGFSGLFCEYDDKACVTYKGQMCANHGRCTLGRCECDENWLGDDCSCPNHDRDCIGPESTEACSGNGICKCGKCVCNYRSSDINEIYYGDYCNDCEECQDKICDKIDKVVKKYCKLEGNITCIENTEVKIETFDADEISYASGTRCVYTLDDDSNVIYKYVYSRGKILKLNIQKAKETVPKANIWIPIGASIGSIILIGLLTAVLWKIIIDHLDSREYEKFLKESVAEGYDVTRNPLYISPTVDFVNPAFQSTEDANY